MSEIFQYNNEQTNAFCIDFHKKKSVYTHLIQKYPWILDNWNSRFWIWKTYPLKNFQENELHPLRFVNKISTRSVLLKNDSLSLSEIMYNVCEWNGVHKKLLSGMEREKTDFLYSVSWRSTLEVMNFEFIN